MPVSIELIRVKRTTSNRAAPYLLSYYGTVNLLLDLMRMYYPALAPERKLSFAKMSGQYFGASCICDQQWGPVHPIML